MRHALKFMHVIGAIGLMGSMACLVVLCNALPPPTSLAHYASLRGVMGTVATWIFLPSLGLTLIFGLLAIAGTTAYQSAGWVWAKAATGILIFESGFVGVLGPMQEEAARSAEALAGTLDAAMLGASVGAEHNTLWILLLVSTANVILGIWRPRFGRRSGSAST